MTIYYVFYVYLILINFLTVKPILHSGETAQLTASIAPSGRTWRKEKRFVTAAFAVLILMFGLRNQEMGVDLSGYLPGFDRLAASSWSDVLNKPYLNYDKGYMFFNKAIGTLVNDRQFFLFACAFFSFAPIGYTVYKNSRNTLFSIIVYIGLPCFLLCFSGLRQAIAIAITFFSYNFIKTKKIVPFLLTILVASTFHYTAFVAVILYPLYRVKLSKNASYISILAIPLIYFLRVPLFLIASKLVKNNAVIGNTGAFTLFMVFSMVYVFCVLFGNRTDEKVNGLINFVLVACVVQAMGSLNQLVVRIGYYYMIYMVLLLPEILDFPETKRNRQTTILRWCIMGCFLIYGLYALKTASWPESNPYYFCWEDYHYSL